MSKTLRQLAKSYGGVIRGDDAVEISDIGPLNSAGPHQLAPLLHRKFIAVGKSTQAGAILVHQSLARHVEEHLLWIHPTPRIALANVLCEFHPEAAVEPAQHPSAIVDTSATIDESASIGPLAVVQSGATIGQRTVLEPHTLVGKGAVIGNDCILRAGSMVLDGCTVGNRVRLGPASVVGSDGFGFLPSGGDVPLRIPQVGTVIIEDDVDIGAQVAVDRATLGHTIIRKGATIDNHVQIAHNADIGAGAIIAAQSGIAGSVRVGNRALLGGQVGIADHLEIGDGARVAAKSGIVADVAPRTTVAGYPGIPHKTWLRAWGTLLRMVGYRRERE